MKEYTVICEWTGSNYSAYVPDLPGCIACDDTLETTERLIKEAIELYIETPQEERRPVSEPAAQARLVAVGM